MGDDNESGTGYGSEEKEEEEDEDAGPGAEEGDVDPIGSILAGVSLDQMPLAARKVWNMEWTFSTLYYRVVFPGIFWCLVA